MSLFTPWLTDFAMVFSQLVRAFCVAGAILWKRVKATVSFFRGCAFYSFVAGAHFVCTPSWVN